MLSLGHVRFQHVRVPGRGNQRSDILLDRSSLGLVIGVAHDEKLLFALLLQASHPATCTLKSYLAADLVFMLESCRIAASLLEPSCIVWCGHE